MNLDWYLFAGGVVLGATTAAVYLALLWAGVKRYMVRGAADPLSWGLTIARIGLLGGALLAVLPLGIEAALGLLAGFVAARSILLARVRAGPAEAGPGATEPPPGKGESNG
jgi:hypothetical protein